MLFLNASLGNILTFQLPIFQFWPNISWIYISIPNQYLILHFQFGSRHQKDEWLFMVPIKWLTMVGKEHKCLICNSSFSEKGTLKKHENSVHKNIKFDCQDCDKQLSTKRHLTRHINSIHKGIKYQCDQCDKEFTQSYNRLSHVQSVHGQKQKKKYPCNLCDYRGTVSHLERHKKSVHEGVKYPCTVCGLKLSSQACFVFSEESS